MKLWELTWLQFNTYFWVCSECASTLVRIPGLSCKTCLEGAWLAQAFQRAEQAQKEQYHAN